MNFLIVYHAYNYLTENETQFYLGFCMQLHDSSVHVTDI